MSTAFGTSLREWRHHRRLSQLDLAVAADVSQRHLSFLETGKSKPSREMVIHLGVVLDLPLRDRNRLLDAAGFAPAYPEHGLDEPALDQVRRVLEQMLEAFEPFPAYVIDRRWDLVMTNRVGSTLISTLVSDPDLAANLARLTFHPDGLRRSVANWPEAATVLLHRLEREAVHRADDADQAALLDEVRSYPGVAELPERPSMPDGSELLVPLVVASPMGELRLFTTIATIGAPHDVTLEELRLEALLPADEATAEALRRL